MNSYQRALCKIEEYNRNNFATGCCCIATGGTGGTSTVQIGTTTTGAPGTQASVTNTGTATNAILNFTIPQGPTGPTYT